MLARNLATAAASVPVTSNTTTIGPWPVTAKFLTFTIENSGVNAALATLVLQGKVLASDANYQTLAGGSNWATSNPLVVQATSGLATLATNGAGLATVNLYGITQCQFTATSAGTSGTTVNVNPVFSE